jgi:4-alpha-glucanotransferase
MPPENRLDFRPGHRTSGILMHITSLPGSFGIGDLGPESRNFADFLAESSQTYWQMLPLNPTSESTGHSPYSSISAFAGNPLLISPDELAKKGYVSSADLRIGKIKPGKEVSFSHALEFKTALLDTAYENFKTRLNKIDDRAFEKFVHAEKYWLDDFALYVTLKKNNRGKPWYEWPHDYKSRNTSALENFSRKHSDEITKVKWIQFIFREQWLSLKHYCNTSGIRLFGDLPFYVSYDSADVWSNRKIFSLDKDGNMKFVSGVPPDYFNDDGQLWGMPVFRWDELKKQDYSWWVRRIENNMQMFDILRLDHFRAFSNFWAVDASEKTARKGKWKKGPGLEFFQVLTKRFGPLPFIAEDLGDIDENVHSLREMFNLPGMKVLQFAFGGDFPDSDHIPHNHQENFVVYTGTHDNNTSIGWFKKDAGEIERKNLKHYFGRKIQAKQIHTLLIRAALASVAKYAIVPMQDLLGQGEESRMNAPATVGGNWLWRLSHKMITPGIVKELNEMTKTFGRHNRGPRQNSV